MIWVWVASKPGDEVLAKRSGGRRQILGGGKGGTKRS